ncbi:S-type pyocin domain-containing protein [Pseudomonas entomophila]|uniref:S-type pyocin domain-containing protein n=1 Tax=Pseudomonas entomophila TaxID=312306 RepID=UPI0031F32A4A
MHQRVITLPSSRASRGHSEILVMPTDGQAIPADVRMLAATYDAQRKLYSATTADIPPRKSTSTKKMKNEKID